MYLLTCYYISSIFDECPERLMAKPYQACQWACGRGDVSTPSFGSHPNPISTRGGGQIMLTLHWCPHQVLKATGAPSYTLQNILFHWICSKFYKFQNGHKFFDLDLMRAVKGPKTPLRSQKLHEGVTLLKKVSNKSCSTTSLTPWRVQSYLSYNPRVDRYDYWGHQPPQLEF